jgi:hypothetical protein
VRKTLEPQDLPPFTLSGSSFEKLVDAAWLLAALSVALLIGSAGLIFRFICASLQLAASLCVRTIKLAQREIVVVPE